MRLYHFSDILKAAQNGPVAQLVRAFVWHTKGRRSESDPVHMNELSKGVAVFIVNNKQEILLLLRRKGTQIGFWEIPTGHIKDGEDKIDAAKREVKEEVGLDISNLIFVGTNIDKNFGFEATIFKSENYTGNAENLDKYNHENMGWFSIDALPSPLGSTTKIGLELLYPNK